MKTSFIADDGTKMAFEFVEEILGCRRYKIVVEGQAARSIVLVGSNTKAHYKIIKIYLAWGMYHFKRLKLWTDSIEQIN